MPNDRESKSRSSERRPSKGRSSRSSDALPQTTEPDTALKTAQTIVDLIRQSETPTHNVFDRSTVVHPIDLRRQEHEVHRSTDGSKSMKRKNALYTNRIRENAKSLAASLTQQAFSNLEESVKAYPSGIPKWDKEGYLRNVNKDYSTIGSKVAASVKHRFPKVFESVLENLEYHDVPEKGHLLFSVEPRFQLGTDKDDASSFFARFGVEVSYEGYKGRRVTKGDSAAVSYDGKNYTYSGLERTTDIGTGEDDMMTKADPSMFVLSVKDKQHHDRKYASRQVELDLLRGKLNKQATKSASKALESLHFKASSLDPKDWRSELGPTASTIAETLKHTKLWSNLSTISQWNRQSTTQRETKKRGASRTAPAGGKTAVSRKDVAKARKALSFLVSDLPTTLSPVSSYLYDSVAAEEESSETGSSDRGRSRSRETKEERSSKSTRSRSTNRSDDERRSRPRGSPSASQSDHGSSSSRPGSRSGGSRRPEVECDTVPKTRKPARGEEDGGADHNDHGEIHNCEAVHV